MTFSEIPQNVLETTRHLLQLKNILTLKRTMYVYMLVIF